MRPPVELGVHRAPRCEPVVSLVRSRRAPPLSPPSPDRPSKILLVQVGTLSSSPIPCLFSLPCRATAFCCKILHALASWREKRKTRTPGVPLPAQASTDNALGVWYMLWSCHLWSRLCGVWSSFMLLATPAEKRNARNPKKVSRSHDTRTPGGTERTLRALVTPSPLYSYIHTSL